MTETKSVYQSIPAKGASFAKADAALSLRPPMGKSSLEQWYLKVRAKPLESMSDGDLARAVRQNVHLPLTIGRCIERLGEEPTAGELYDGELILACLMTSASFKEDYPGQAKRVRELAEKLLANLDAATDVDELWADVSEEVVERLRKVLRGEAELEVPTDNGAELTLAFSVGDRSIEVATSPGDALSIGAAADCTIRFDEDASQWQPHHADIQRKGDQLTLFPYYPVVVDGLSTMDPVSLSRGDDVTIGHIKLSVR